MGCIFVACEWQTGSGLQPLYAADRAVPHGAATSWLCADCGAPRSGRCRSGRRPNGWRRRCRLSWWSGCRRHGCCGRWVGLGRQRLEDDEGSVLVDLWSAPARPGPHW